MSGLEVAGCVLGILPVLIETISAIISTQYDVERTSRSLKIVSETIRDLERTLGTVGESVESWKKLEEKSRYFTLSRSEIDDACRQLSSLTVLSDPRKWGMKGGRLENSKEIKKTYAKLIEGCQMIGTRAEPTFWKLQRWILHLGEGGLRIIRVRLPDAILHPSPTSLLMSWLLLSLSAVCYYEMHPGDRHRNIVLLGSVTAAIMMAIIESTSIDTMLLTNLPWCLACGTLVRALLGGINRVTSGDRNRHCLWSKKTSDPGTEKIDPAWPSVVGVSEFHA